MKRWPSGCPATSAVAAYTPPSLELCYRARPGQPMAIDIRLDQLRTDLYALANAQFESPEYRKLLSVHFTADGARAFEIQRTHFVINRRDCWGFASGGAPLDVKRLIWEHEREELIGFEGIPDHVTLGIQEAEQVG